MQGKSQIKSIWCSVFSCVTFSCTFLIRVFTDKVIWVWHNLYARYAIQYQLGLNCSKNAWQILIRTTPSILHFLLTAKYRVAGRCYAWKCPSVRLFALSWLGLPSASFEQGIPLPVHGLCLCVVNQGAFADNFEDAVDRLLIFCRKFQCIQQAYPILLT